jgi:uncharacterized protein YkwD
MKPRTQITLASIATMLFAGAMMLFVVAVASAAKQSAPESWLARVNMYRAMDQLPPIASDPALTEGAQKHAVYLIKNFAKQVRNGTANSADMSSESSKRSFSTSQGRTIAPHSEIDFTFGKHQSVEEAIDRWIKGPHHRMLLLNPELQRIGYGYYCEDGLCAQIVDVEDGIAHEPVDPDKEVAIEFPPANSTMSLDDLPQESPDPLTACPGYKYPAGLPITFQIGAYAGAKLTSYSIVRTDAPGAPPIEACGFDAYSYRNPSRSQLGVVIGGLKAFSAVVVIPRHPLAPGSYRATVTVNDRDYGWSFTIAPGESAAR